MNNYPNYNNYGPIPQYGASWNNTSNISPTSPLYSGPNTNPYAMPTQQVPMAIGLPGKVVNAQEDIAPQDVLMNGTVSFFPKSDYSEIYAKCWNSNGAIDTRTYILKPAESQKSSSASSDILSQILSRLDEIEKKVTYKNKYGDTPRKEVKTNE